MFWRKQLKRNDMPNSRRIGFGFECRVRNFFEKQGFMVIRQGRSRFPDLVIVCPTLPASFVECKVGKYLSADEKRRANELIRKGYKFVVAYRIKKGSRKLGFSFYDKEVYINDEGKVQGRKTGG